MKRLSECRFALLAMIAACLLAGCTEPKSESFTDKVRKAAEEAAYTGPALWRVTDEDTTVYLFGTVHTLREDTKWQTSALEAALKEAEAIYFEADVESTRAQNDAAAVVTTRGLFSDGQTLRGILPEKTEREVEDAARLLGVPMQGLDNLQPWYANFALADLHLDQLGFSRALGVERILGAEARRMAKPFRYLETGAEQITIIANIPIAEQISMLEQTAIQIEDDPQFLDRMIAEWAEGDVDTLATMIADDDVFGSGAVYETLLKGRNANWAGQITTLMADEPGTFLVAVGAAHLAGEDSVQNMLATSGLKVSRENPMKDKR